MDQMTQGNPGDSTPETEENHRPETETIDRRDESDTRGSSGSGELQDRSSLESRSPSSLAEKRIDGAAEEFLIAKGVGRTNDTGTYADNLELSIGEFLEFLDEFPHPPETFEELSDRTLREFASHLDAEDLANSSTLTYYANVSAFLGWSTREGYLDENPAQTQRAKEPLPEDDGRRSGDQPAWTPEQRSRITDYVDREAESALDTFASAVDPDLGGDTPVEETSIREESGLNLAAIADIPDPIRARWDALKILRDRALVNLIAYSGVRGAEILSHPQDDRRDGCRWRDLDIKEGRLTVFSKKQEYDDRAVPGQATPALERYKRLLDPNDDWPVFPSMHRPSLYEEIRTGLVDEGPHDKETVESMIDDRPTFEVLRDYDLSPPPLTTTGARTVLKRLSKDAEIDVDHPDHDYLTLHGARRGAGEAMVRSEGFAAAARLLDNTVRVVRDRYSHIEAGELADEATKAFDQVDE